jgi:hypothetical protein
MAATPRLSLQFLSVGQAQKEFTVNETLQTLDTLVGGAVEEPPRSAPPSTPPLGACYIVADGATDAWIGKSQCVAAWTSGGWRFIAPVDGMTLYERTGGTFATFRDGGWETGILRGTSVVIDGQQVVGARGAAIESPSGGGVVDAEARIAIGSILDTLRQHGLIAV